MVGNPQGPAFLARDVARVADWFAHARTAGRGGRSGRTARGLVRRPAHSPGRPLRHNLTRPRRSHRSAVRAADRSAGRRVCLITSARPFRPETVRCSGRTPHHSSGRHPRPGSSGVITSRRHVGAATSCRDVPRPGGSFVFPLRSSCPAYGERLVVPPPLGRRPTPLVPRFPRHRWFRSGPGRRDAARGAVDRSGNRNAVVRRARPARARAAGARRRRFHRAVPHPGGHASRDARRA